MSRSRRTAHVSLEVWRGLIILRKSALHGQQNGEHCENHPCRFHNASRKLPESAGKRTRLFDVWQVAGVFIISSRAVAIARCIASASLEGIRASSRPCATSAGTPMRRAGASVERGRASRRPRPSRPRGAVGHDQVSDGFTGRTISLRGKVPSRLGTICVATASTPSRRPSRIIFSRFLRPSSRSAPAADTAQRRRRSLERFAAIRTARTAHRAADDCGSSDLESIEQINDVAGKLRDAAIAGIGQG